MFKPVYLRDPPAYFHPRILVGAGAMLTLPFVRQYGITHVINCASHQDCPEWWPMFFPDKYAVLNAIDSLHVNITDWYPAFEATMHEFLRSGNGVVYVHCQAGINRSGFLALLYSVKNLGMELNSMVQSVRRQRPCILQNSVFMDQVKSVVNGRVQNSEAPRSNDSVCNNGNA